MSLRRLLILPFNQLTVELQQRIPPLVTALRQWQDLFSGNRHSEWPSLNFDLLGHPYPLSTDSQSLLDEFILWAVPKKRTSHSKKRMRMTHKYLKPKHHFTVCPKCKNLKLLHVLCGHCLKETLNLTAIMRREEVVGAKQRSVED